MVLLFRASFFRSQTAHISDRNTILTSNHARPCAMQYAVHPEANKSLSEINIWHEKRCDFQLPWLHQSHHYHLLISRHQLGVISHAPPMPLLSYIPVFHLLFFFIQPLSPLLSLLFSSRSPSLPTQRMPLVTAPISAF